MEFIIRFIRSELDWIVIVGSGQILFWSIYQGVIGHKLKATRLSQKVRIEAMIKIKDWLWLNASTINSTVCGFLIKFNLWKGLGFPINFNFNFSCIDKDSANNILRIGYGSVCIFRRIWFITQLNYMIEFNWRI